VNRRWAVLRAVIEKFPMSKYRISKELPMPTSTVYYELERLRREFYVAEENGVVRPTLKGFVKGVELFGCDVVAPAFGRYLSGLGIEGLREAPCKFLTALVPSLDALKDDLVHAATLLLGRPITLRSVMGLDSELVKLVASIFASLAPMIASSEHRGVVFVDEQGRAWFLGFCRICGGYVFRKCSLIQFKKIVRKSPE